MEILEWIIHGRLESDGHNIFSIRYGPATIFSGIIPGLDANFISPKYTKSNPYQVTSTPEYEEISEKTKELKNKSISDFNTLMTEMFNILGEGLNEAEIKVIIIADDTRFDECQMLILYGDTCLVVETGDNTVERNLSQLMRGADSGNDEAVRSYSYSDFKSLYDGTAEWKKYIDMMIKDKKWKWTTNSATKTDIVINTTTKNFSSEQDRNNWIQEFINGYGYQNSTVKFNDNSRYYWEIKQGENTIGYELKYFKSNKDDLSPVLTYSLTKTAYDTENLKTGETKLSASYELKNTIGKWYLTLRTIALVGLLSVLVYVGIRIIISSTGQEKAKYQKMIGDWVAAICILFVLHYIMAFTMAMVDSVLDIFKINDIVSANGEDVLMTSIRQSVNTSGALSTSFAELLIYLALVVFTAVFTFHYLKRLVYLAFFTMIAPLIALTYPLDKIKDGQAQAFGIWIKEYIFNALMPIMHLLLYYIFVGSAMDLATSNPIYALVCIGFLIPAEKFFRKMFGFDKATSSSQFGAAAGGAMVMNAINKISHGGSGSGSSSSSGGKSSSSVKTANQGYIPPPKENSSGGSQNGGSQNGGNQNGGNQNGGNQGNSFSNSPTATSVFGEKVMPAAKKQRTLKGTGRGLQGVARRYVNKENAKKAGKRLRRLGVGALGGAALGTFGLAAGIASGDLSNVGKYAGAAAAVGYGAANKAGDKLVDIEKQNRETFKENKYGTDEYLTRQAVKELNDDVEFRRACEATGITDRKDRESLIRQFHANGVTSSDAIRNATNVWAQKDHRNKSRDQIVAAAKLNQTLTKSYWGQPKNKDEFRKRLEGKVRFRRGRKSNGINFRFKRRFKLGV